MFYQQYSSHYKSFQNICIFISFMNPDKFSCFSRLIYRITAGETLTNIMRSQKSRATRPDDHREASLCSCNLGSALRECFLIVELYC